MVQREAASVKGILGVWIKHVESGQTVGFNESRRFQLASVFKIPVLLTLFKKIDEPAASLHDARERFEREYILRALASQNGNISRTADALGVERSNLYRKMRAFGIAPARKSEEEEPV